METGIKYLEKFHTIFKTYTISADIYNLVNYSAYKSPLNSASTMLNNVYNGILESTY